MASTHCLLVTRGHYLGIPALRVGPPEAPVLIILVGKADCRLGDLERRPLPRPAREALQHAWEN